VGRIALNVNLVSLLKGVLTPTQILGLLDPATRAAVGANTPVYYQNNRCPGSMERNFDGSYPWQPDSVKCDKSQVINGQ
jgi:hypothetical protein